MSKVTRRMCVSIRFTSQTKYKTLVTDYTDAPVACSSLPVYGALEGGKPCGAVRPITQMHAQVPGEA
jgi:hypothetical protein